MFVAIFMVVGAPSFAFAQNETPPVSEDTLADEVNDPVATLTQIQLKDQFTPAEYGTNAQPNTLQFRSVFAVRPHLLTPLEQVIRPTIQVVTVPRGRGGSTTTALDDIQLLDLVVMPFPDVKTTGFRWGVGPYFVFPTSTSQFAGKGTWQMGPALGFAWQLDRLKFSWLFQQSTSFAYTSSRSTSVASIQIQPLLTFDLSRGWYLKSADANWRINFRHKSSTEIPLSVGLGKVSNVGEGCSINVAVSGEWMAYRQFSTQTEQFTLNFQANLLLPRLEF
ncbi:MAG: hypothetical protein ACREQT_03390 [Candidatus Binataceae bacterium]